MERFWSKVAPPNERGCRVWTAGCDGRGYGAFKLDGRQRVASRVAWELTHGPVPPGLCVLHRCDERPCCEPSHLFVGTKAENNADRDAKGRHRVGFRAKLTAAQVAEIRASSETGRAIALRLGVSESTISLARSRRTWR